MDWQTALNIGLALLAGILGVKNYQMSQRKETQRESEEMTEIRIQYGQVKDLLRDLQKDVKNVSILSERVVSVETKLDEIYRRIERLEESHG